MSTPDKLEAVQKVSETMKSNPAQEMDQLSATKEHFQSLIDSPQALKPTSFERVDTTAFAPENVQNTETNPIFGDQNVSAQRNGSATDQEGKRRGKEDDEVEGVSATGSKKSAGSTSMIDEAGKVNTNTANVSKVSPEGIKAQTKQVMSQIEQVKTQLSQAKGDIKPSYQTLLRNRLSHIDDNVKIALNKAGIEHTPPHVVAEAGKSNPIQKFMGYLTNSENELANLHSTIENLSMTGKEISPANMLAIQMKMGYISQQVELFTSLLNKALESTKTLMNVQV